MTKAEIKHIKQLQQKKYRQASGEFLVEGLKSIIDFLQAGFVPKKIYSTTAFDNDYKQSIEIEIIDNKSLKSISLLKNPKDALAIFEIKMHHKIPSKDIFWHWTTYKIPEISAPLYVQQIGLASKILYVL